MSDEIQPADAKSFTVVNNSGSFTQSVCIGFLSVAVAVIGYTQWATKAVTPVVPVVVPVVESEISGPSVVEVGELAEFEVNAKISDPQWLCFPPAKIKSHGTIAYLETRTAGEFTLLCIAVKDGKSWYAEHRVTIGQSPIPPPVPPIPPTPPVPPGPTPVKQLRVLFVYETSANQTREQLNIINSTKIRGYLNEKAKGEYRYWDKDVDVSKETAAWQEIWKATKPQLGTLPSIVIIDGTKGQVYPLPATEAETLALIQKAGG